MVWSEKAVRRIDRAPLMLLWHQPLALVGRAPTVYAGCVG